MPRSAEATRARILETAYDLFYRQGFARVGVEAAAPRARELQLLLEGSQSLMLIHGGRTIAAAAATVAKRLIATAVPRQTRVANLV